MNRLPSKLPEHTSSALWKTAEQTRPEKIMKAKPDCAVKIPIAPKDKFAKETLAPTFVLRTRVRAGINVSPADILIPVFNVLRIPIALPIRNAPITFA